MLASPTPAGKVDRDTRSAGIGHKCEMRRLKNLSTAEGFFVFLGIVFPQKDSFRNTSLLREIKKDVSGKPSFQAENPLIQAGKHE